MKPARNIVLVELHVPDFERVIVCFWAGNEEFYKQSYFKRFPKNTKRGYGVEIVPMIADIEAYYHKVKDFAKVVGPLALRSWGLKDFRIEDPFGYYIRVTSIHNILDDSNPMAT